MKFEKHFRFSLNSGEAHIWVASINQQKEKEAKYWSTLSSDEKERANRFYFEKDKTGFTVARGILRQLSGNYLNLEAKSVVFDYQPKGKPSLSQSKDLKFNISHSSDLVLFAFYNNIEIGVDVEWINKAVEWELISGNFFSKNEQQALHELEDTLKPLGFFNCWTRKEAFIKAEGDGLTFPLDKFSVNLKPGETPELLELETDPNSVKDWSLFSFIPGRDYVGALAIKDKVNQVSFFQLENLEYV